MANHKSAKKRIRTSARRNEINKMTDSEIKTTVKKVLAATDKTEAEKLYKEAVSLLDRSTTKGQIHLNTASRKKAAMTKHLNSLQTA